MKLNEKKALQTLSAGYVFALLLFFPLVYHNNYIDIVQVKKYFFLCVTAVYAVLCLLLTMCCELRGRRAETIEKHQFNSIDRFAVVLCAGLVLSTMFAGDVKDALWGYTGRNFGVVTLAAGLLGFFLVERFFVMTQSVLWAYLIGSGCVYLLVILNAFGVDLLGMKENLDPAQHYFFVSTMGNMDVTTGFAALMVPVGMMLFYCAKEKFSQRIYGAYVCLGFLAMLCARCDTGVVCVAAAFAVSFWLALLPGGRMRAAQTLFLFWVECSAVAGVARIIFSDRAYAFDGFCGIATSWQAVVAEVAVLALLTAYVRRSGEADEKALKKAGRVFAGTLAAAAAVFVLALLLANVTGAGDGWLSALKITDEFGNYRGYIWKRSIKAYLDAPLFRKVFGYGMNQFPVFIHDYEEEMTLLFQSSFLDAHNEYLQMVVTAGIIGAVGFFGMFAAGLALCVRKIKRDGTQTLAPLAGIAVLTVYFAQAFANNPQVFTTPLYFVFLGILARADSAVADEEK